MAGYVFIGNSAKPSEKELNSREMIKFGNVSRPCLEIALGMGYDVYCGINRNNAEELRADIPVKLYDSHTYRSITAFRDNFIAYSNLKKLIKSKNIEVIHCNTPVGGMVGRVCGKIFGVKKVIYTAHGFHFYKGAPLFNRTVLKWAEMLMAHWSDAILTMNKEDYTAAKKFKLKKGGKVYYIPGVGIDTKDFATVKINRKDIRESLGVSEDDIVCISMGDLIPRKNYGTAIKAIGKCKNKNIHYLICGEGSELDNLRELAKENNIENRVHFLGFRTDIKELLKTADIFLFTTLQEGLPRSMMEAMASGLPCIASKIRGNVDLLEEGKGGYLVEIMDYSHIANRLDILAEDSELRQNMALYNLEHIKKFDVREVKKIICNIYMEVLK